MLDWSVSATAGMSSSATRLTSGLIRVTPSTSEYSECTCRWTNSAAMASGGVTQRNTVSRMPRPTVDRHFAGSGSCRRQAPFGIPAGSQCVLKTAEKALTVDQATNWRKGAAVDRRDTEPLQGVQVAWSDSPCARDRSPG